MKRCMLFIMELNTIRKKAEGYNKKEMFNIDEDVFTAIQVARLHPVKGHEVLFDALQQTKIREN